MLTQATFAPVLPVLRTATVIASSATESTLLGIVPVKGWGTIRVFLFTDQEVTFRVYTKPRRLSSTSLITMRLFASRTVAASGSMEPLIFNVHADYAKFTAQPTGSTPTVFECGIELFP